MSEERARELLAAASATIPNAYVGAYVREFVKHVPGVDLRSAIDCAEAHYDMSCGDPIEDAQNEADESRRAS